MKNSCPSAENNNETLEYNYYEPLTLTFWVVWLTSIRYFSKVMINQNKDPREKMAFFKAMLSSSLCCLFTDSSIQLEKV